MSETDYNARLYEKMKAEQDKYRDWLLHQEPSEILNHTYEYTMREDIVMCIGLLLGGIIALLAMCLVQMIRSSDTQISRRDGDDK